LPRHIAGPAIRRVLVGALVASLAMPAAAVAAEPSPAQGRAPLRIRHLPQPAVDGTVPQSIIVRYRAGTPRSRRLAARTAVRADFVRELGIINADVFRPRGRSVAATLTALRRDPNVLAAAPSRPLAVHSDPVDEELFGYQWGHENTGQDIIGSVGIADVDTDAREAMAAGADGSGVVVAVIDDGVDFGHADLAGQAWQNPGETGGGKETNGEDDDDNGFVDDVNGWDVCNDLPTLHDVGQDFHGTAVAGVIAAAQDGIGAVGVAPGARIMGLRFLTELNDTEDDPFPVSCADDVHAIMAIEYAAANGADIINASWGGPDPGDGMLEAAIEASGLLFVSSAGNGGFDETGDNLDDNNPDTESAYPAAFDSANMIVVAAATNRGALTEFSNYGRLSVDVAGPGELVLAPVADAVYPDDYSLWDGTSFSAPYVAGVAALIASENPSLVANPAGLKNRLIYSGMPLASLAGKTVSGRLVNARTALDFTLPTAGAPTVTFKTPSAIGSSAVKRIAWTAASDASGIASYRLYQRVNAGAWTLLSQTTSPSALDRALAFGSSYQFMLRVIDRATNVRDIVLTPFTLVRHQDGSGFATYTGRWRTGGIGTASGGQVHYSTQAGARVRFTYTGSGIEVVAPKGPTRGSARIYVDGVLARTVSLRSGSTLARQVIFARTWAVRQPRTITVVVVGTRGHPRVDIDAFVVRT
jgi:subtilisin family serine protease